MPVSSSEPTSPPPTSLLSHTSALLDDVADEVREALHLYDANGGNNGGTSDSAGASSSGYTTSTTELGTDASLVDEGIVGDLMDVYNELAAHRKGVTQLMAKVKRCALRAERAVQAITVDTSESILTKPKNKRGRKKGSATGLTKPFPVSDLLCSFMGVPSGTLLSRSEVTKCLHRYIKEQGLKDTTNGQYVVPDTTLKALLNWGEADEDKLHIFAMQKRMNVHFLYGSSAETVGRSSPNVQQGWA